MQENNITMAAPKGNKYALNNNGGRPPIYSDPQVLYEKCLEYFDLSETLEEQPSITGLTIHLGFDSRSTLYEYSKKEEFSHIIKRAMLIVENEYEIAARNDKVPTGAIFCLKNMGWSDKQEIDHTTGGEKISFTPISFTSNDKGQ